ncbi:hypothetical protein F4167_19110 [Candidatus Poribacteria bacterium]|nr:hypothetical protein [Candidatus Poribacteria bacterium]
MALALCTGLLLQVFAWTDNTSSNYLSLSGSTDSGTVTLSNGTHFTSSYASADASASPAGDDTSYSVTATLGCTADTNTSSIPSSDHLHTSRISWDSEDRPYNYDSYSNTAGVISYKSHPVSSYRKHAWWPWSEQVTRSFSHSESAYMSSTESSSGMSPAMSASISGSSNHYVQLDMELLSLSSP